MRSRAGLLPVSFLSPRTHEEADARRGEVWPKCPDLSQVLWWAPVVSRGAVSPAMVMEAAFPCAELFLPLGGSTPRQAWLIRASDVPGTVISAGTGKGTRVCPMRLTSEVFVCISEDKIVSLLLDCKPNSRLTLGANSNRRKAEGRGEDRFIISSVELRNPKHTSPRELW